jgi:hypothetical protein
MDTARCFGIERCLSRVLHYLSTELEAPRLCV